MGWQVRGKPLWVRRAYNDDAWAESLAEFQKLFDDTER